jgi:hypothetical protein
MTNSPTPVPAQRQSSAGPTAQLSVHEPLAGRLLVHIAPQRVGYVLNQIDPIRSGLVVTGKGALRKVAELRSTGGPAPLLADPAFYETMVATAQEPFMEPSDQLPSGDPLGRAVQEQLAVGASAALTPTGYLRAGDGGALRAAAQAVAALDDPRVVFVVPADAGWLASDQLTLLIEILGDVPGVKAVMLGGQLDPLAGHHGAVEGLVRLLAEVPGVALLRSDLAAFGALARGAAFAGYGAGAKQRHVVPPWEPAQKSVPVTSPSVLYPDLMGLFLGQTLAKRFAASPAPVCECAACGRRDLDSFAMQGQSVAAAGHNTAVLMSWLRALEANPAGVERERWWQQWCSAAVARYPLVNVAIGQPGAFKPKPQLLRWAELGAAGSGDPSNAVPVN